jgi:hypothetical protein
MTNQPSIIKSGNISYAWALVLAECMRAGRSELNQLMVTVSPPEGGTDEDVALRAILDKFLLANGLQKCSTVAQTIFPFSLQSPGSDAQALFATYRKIYDRLKRCRANAKGTYFKRMIDYEPFVGEGFVVTPVNQLEKVITDLKTAAPRRSGLQLVIFDPTRDHIHSPYLKFPCLQQVSVSKDDHGNIMLMALYPLHYLIERAYGNYLGLLRLGQFVAKECGLKFRSMTCIAATGKREMTKEACSPLLADVETYINSIGGFADLSTKIVSHE